MTGIAVCSENFFGTGQTAVSVPEFSEYMVCSFFQKGGQEYALCDISNCGDRTW